MEAFPAARLFESKTMSIRLAFRVGGDDLEGRVICYFTHSWACHVEVLVPKLGWVSAHQQTGHVDVIAELPGDPALWRFAEVPYTVTQAALDFVAETIGARYDYLSILDFVLHTELLTAGREICSRFVRDFIDHCDWAGDGARPLLPPNPSPGDLVRVFMPNVTMAGQAEIFTVTEEELAAFAKRCAGPVLISADRKVGGPLGIDSNAINAAAVAVKALCDDARAKLDAIDPQIAAIVGPVAKLANVIDADKLIALWRAEFASGIRENFLKEPTK
jgi:hypothetical protein